MEKKFIEQKERELTPEVLEAQEFFIEQLSFLADRQKLQQAPIRKLFEDYKEYINSDATQENFQNLIIKYNDTESNQDEYREYLLGKLPKELQERNSEKTVKELEEIHGKRKKIGSKMLLGFHVSAQDIPETDTIKESQSESQIGDVVLQRGGYVQYSDNPHYLWSSPAPSRYLYLVEGSEEDKKINDMGWRARAIHGQGLEILAKFNLTKELEDVLGLKFSNR